MRDRRTLRIVRIAFSLMSGGFCVMVAIFWARSYSHADYALVKILPRAFIHGSAGDGRMCLWIEYKAIDRWSDWSSHRIIDHAPPDAENRIPCFGLAFWPTLARLYVAHWLLLVVAGFFAAVPWLPRTFSLRGLLVLTTVVAAIGSVIAWIDATF